MPTHADIASRVSTHREAVTRELIDFARAGLVERRSGALIIRDVSRLARLGRLAIASTPNSTISAGIERRALGALRDTPAPFNAAAAAVSTTGRAP